MEAALRVSALVKCGRKDADQIIERLAQGWVCCINTRGKKLICAELHTPWRAALKELEIV
jgi:hypothetical protein